MGMLRSVQSASGLRWLAVAPLSMLALCFALVIVAQVAPVVSGLRRGYATELVAFGAASLVAPIVLILVGAAVAPAGRRLVGCGMAALCVLIHIGVWPRGLDSSGTPSVFLEAGFTYVLGFMSLSTGIALAWWAGRPMWSEPSGA